MIRAASVLAAGLALASLPALAASTNEAHRAAVHLAREIGSRPAASAAEGRAHQYVARRFRKAGLRVRVTPFPVPGKGRSRNVVGVHQGRRNCLKVAMAHTDSVPAGPGAIDNASGVGVLVGLAGRLPELRTRCDVWLVATGAEERVYTGAADHLGALQLVRHLRHRRSAKRLRYALSLDMVGLGRRFQLRSPRTAPRPRVERQVLRAGRRSGVPLRWLRDSGTGNSDHRELELAGLPALVMQVWSGSEPCYHSSCDSWRRLRPGSLARAQRIAEDALRRR